LRKYEKRERKVAVFKVAEAPTVRRLNEEDLQPISMLSSYV